MGRSVAAIFSTPDGDGQMKVDPIHQFQINRLVPIFTFRGHEIAFTNSALFMLIIILVVSALMIGATAPRAVIPGRFQSIAEMSYEFVANMLRSSAGEEGMKFFPFVFTLFMFVLAANMIGLIPFTFTVTSQLIITASLALLVFVIVVVYGFYRNGLHFLNLFVPKGVPIYILPAIVVIEILSFLSRPISHSVRLFANMLAGHITLQVFAGFIIMLAGFGIAGIFGAALPLVLVIMLTALEFLVAFLQAYVFAILTCIYLNDAIHPGH
jgi:F-type H+-transporting ATPase subunit a